MKHLLIIISILLLSSPVIGDNHKGETLYRWETSSGYQWMIFGDKDTHPVYKGDVENGKPNGQGTHTTPEGYKYEGEWKDGVKNGQGTETYPDGSEYIGGYKDGKYNGQGIRTLSDGKKYEGEWKDGKRNGQGTFTYPDDGRKYEGEWKGDIPWNGTGYDKNGNITTKVVNGKIYIQYPPLKPTPSSPVSDPHYFFTSLTVSK